MTSSFPPSPSLSADSFTDGSESGLAAAFSMFEDPTAKVMTSSTRNAGLSSGNRDNGPATRPQSKSSASSAHDHTQDRAAAVDEQESVDALGVKSERFFFVPDMLTFVVEGTVYCVHAYLFSMCSPFWAKKLACEPRPGPTYLSDVTKPEMDAFLSTQYPTTAAVGYARTVPEWTAILRLTTMWQFEVGRKHAISALDSRLESPLERLVLARAHDVEAWLHPAFLALCMRPEPLSPDEARRLSLEDVLTVMTAREGLLKGNGARMPSEKVVSEYMEKYIRTPSKPPESTGVSSTLSVPPTAEQLKRLSQLLLEGSYHDVVSALDTDNMKTFSQVLADFSSALKSSTRFDPVLQAIFRRGAIDPSFIPIGTQYLTSLPHILVDLRKSYSERVSLDKGDVTALLRSNVALLQRVWSACNDSIDRFGSLDLALRHTLSTAHQAYVRTDFETMAGKCEYLGQNVELYKERSANLCAFVESLADAGLIART